LTQSTRLTDGWTDGQTILIAYAAWKKLRTSSRNSDILQKPGMLSLVVACPQDIPVWCFVGLCMYWLKNKQ